MLRIIMENDAIAISQKVIFRSDDIPLGEQTVAQVTIILLSVIFCKKKFNYFIHQLLNSFHLHYTLYTYIIIHLHFTYTYIILFKFISTNIIK